jgi:hypothetical protein
LLLVESQLTLNVVRILQEPFLDIFQGELKASWVHNNFNMNLKQDRS